MTVINEQADDAVGIAARHAASREYDINGWTLTPTGDGLRLRWDLTGPGTLISSAGSVHAFQRARKLRGTIRWLCQIAERTPVWAARLA
jgi:hypothetical protein